jgi:hypothetical protein
MCIHWLYNVTCPYNVINAERGELLQIGGDLLDRAGQRAPLVLRSGRDGAVDLDHDRQR